MTIIETSITSVQVFSESARISATGRQALKAGSHQLTVINLPTTLVEGSLRVSANASHPLRLYGIEIQRAFHERTPNQEAEKLEEAIEKIDYDIQHTNGNLETLQKRINHLDGLLDSARTFAFNLVTGKFTPEAHQVLLTTCENQRNQAITSILDARSKITKLERSKTKLQNELNLIKSMRPVARNDVHIGLELEADSQVELNLTYQVKSAYWKPVYDFIASDASIEIIYQAEVVNNTGEDWQDVNLSVSSAKPAQNTTLPEVKPWYLDFYAPQLRAMTAAAPASFSRKLSEKTDGAGKDNFLLDEITNYEAEPQQAELETSGSNVNYQIAGKSTILSDSASHQVRVARFSLTAQTVIQIFPRVSTSAYKVMTVKNTTANIFLPGKVQLFDGQLFIGTTEIKSIQPDEETRFCFGIDERLFVEHKLIKRDVEKQWMSDRRRITYAWCTKIINHSGVTQQIKLINQIPLPRNEEIHVKFIKSSMPPEEVNKTNQITWAFQLEKGKDAEITMEYAVDYPRDRQITGLP